VAGLKKGHKKRFRSSFVKEEEDPGIYALFVQEDSGGDLFRLPKIKQSSSSKMGTPARWEQIREQRWEWDFRELDPEEFPVAVAWEYARELKDTFTRFSKKVAGKPYGMFRSDCLPEKYLDFISAAEWPSRPYQSLSDDQRKQALAGEGWRIGYPKKKSEDSVQEVTMDHLFSQRLAKALNPGGKFEPCRAVLVIDLTQKPKLLLKHFQKILVKKDLLLSQGRPRFQRDLTALGALRLDRYFEGDDYSGFDKWYLANDPLTLKKMKNKQKSPFVGYANRGIYLRRAMARLGAKTVGQKDLHGIVPFFTFFKNVR